MTDFKLHDATTAPDDSKPLLTKSKAAYGMIPGLHAVMAEAPGLLEAYQRVHKLFVNSSFDKGRTDHGVAYRQCRERLPLLCPGPYRHRREHGCG